MQEKQTLRIGEFTDTFLPVVDGVGRVALAYSETLARMGHQVSVVAPMYDTGYMGNYPFELVDFKAVRVPGLKQYRIGEAMLDAHYRQRIRNIPLDIVHAHSPFTAGSEALRLAAVRHLPLVATFHSKYYDDFLRATRSESLARVATKIVVDYFERCDEVWAVSRNAGDVLRSYGYEGEVQVMPNGADLRTLNPADVREVERRWNLGDDPLLLFVGQMDWKKNILTILEACSLLKHSGKPFRLGLAGQGMDMMAISGKIHELNLQDCAQMVGHITDTSLLDALYARASLFVFPSLYDTSAMVVREAAVMGTPSVMVRKCTACETIREEFNGYFCENSPADLARVIARCLADPDGLAEMGRRAQETIPIAWSEVMESVVERYTRLVALGKEGKLRDKHRRIV